jgi:hypothetical protein
MSKQKGTHGSEVPLLRVEWLRIPNIHCETPTWWQEFGIYHKSKTQKRLLGIGRPPEAPTRTYESPLLEAMRYEKLLEDPFIKTQEDVARELGITRARVSQIMGLLKLPEEIQKTLLGLSDQKAIRYFSERRLRPLLTINNPSRQKKEFSKMKDKIQL